MTEIVRDLTRRDFTIPVSRYDPETRVVSGVISSGALDHWGDVIDQDGIKIRSSVPLLWAHDSRQPIGRSLGIQRNGDKTAASFRLASAGVDPTADRIHALAKDGVISSLSVGLLPKRWEGNVLRERASRSLARQPRRQPRCDYHRRARRPRTGAFTDDG